MAALITGPMAAALERRRDRCNALFQQAQSAGKVLDAGAFAEHVSGVLKPIVEAVDAVDSAATDRALETLFGLSLSLFAADLLGPRARIPSIVDAWKRLLPAVPHLVRLDARRVAGAATNALANIAGIVQKPSASWTGEMLGLAGALDSVPFFLEAGTIVAWRCGMAHLRHSALAACRNIPPSLAANALGVPSAAATIGTLLNRLEKDPWVLPGEVGDEPRTLQIRGFGGAFRGFGGQFISPPTVVAADDSFLVSDTKRTWILTADAFGATLLPTTPSNARRGGQSPPTPSPLTEGVDVRGSARLAGLQARFDILESPSSVASNGTTLAVTIPYSHSVYLVAPGPPAKSP